VTHGGDASEDEMCIVAVMFTPEAKGVQLLTREVTMSEGGDHICGCPAGPTTASASAAGAYSKMLVAHGWCMIIAWGLLFPAGATMPLFWREAFSSDGRWYRVHRLMMTSGGLLTLIGFILAVLSTSDHFSFAGGPHKLIGLIVVVLMCIQLLAAVLRPHLPNRTLSDPPPRPSTRRRLWQLSHRCIAVVVLALSIVQIVTGPAMLRSLSYASRGMMIGLYACYALLLVMAIYGGLVGHRRSKRTKAKTFGAVQLSTL
jgi:hypothetical protein